MVTLREAAQQALEALKAFQYRSEGCVQPDFVDDAITALRQALEAEQQPETCKACGEGRADLAVLRICDKCGSEYSSQAEFDLAMRLQAERQDEPVAWMVKNGVVDYQLLWSKSSADALAVEMQKRHDLSGSLSAFHVQPLYTHPQPAQQPLSDEQILRHIICSPRERAMFLRFARAIERAHGITGEKK